MQTIYSSLVHISEKYAFDTVEEGLDIICNRTRTIAFMGEESLNFYLMESPMPAHVRILWLPVNQVNLIFAHNSPLRTGLPHLECFVYKLYTRSIIPNSVFANALAKLRDSGLEENLRQRWIKGHIASIEEDMAGESGSVRGGQLILGFAFMMLAYVLSLGVLCLERLRKSKESRIIPRQWVRAPTVMIR